MANILVVDDDDHVRDMLVIFLQGKGHFAVGVENGEKGLDIILRRNIHLVVTDLEMPIMRGDEMLIKAGYPPAILVSGRFSWLTTDVEKVREFPLLNSLIGRCSFLAKPFNLATFEKAVDDALAA